MNVRSQEEEVEEREEVEGKVKAVEGENVEGEEIVVEEKGGGGEEKKRRKSIP